MHRGKVSSLVWELRSHLVTWPTFKRKLKVATYASNFGEATHSCGICGYSWKLVQVRFFQCVDCCRPLSLFGSLSFFVCLPLLDQSPCTLEKCPYPLALKLTYTVVNSGACASGEWCCTVSNRQVSNIAISKGNSALFVLQWAIVFLYLALYLGAFHCLEN